MLQVVMTHPVVIAGFKEWVASHPGWMLTPPIALGSDPDDKVCFITPTPEAFAEWRTYGG